MFDINDTVKYGTSGVCKIVDIAYRNMNGANNKYYILKPVHQENATIYVPAENQNLISKMQKILNIEEINSLINEMPLCDMEWVQDDKERQEQYRQMILRGDRRELISLIRTVYTQQQALIGAGKKLHAADERLMKEAEKLLYDEFAAVLDIDPNKVVSFIMDKMKERTETSISDELRA